MSSASDTAYLHTRAAVMGARLYTPETLLGYIELPLEELAKRLDLDRLLEEGVSAERLNRLAEKALIAILLDEMSVLLRPLGGVERSILIHWTRKFELYNLKALIRGRMQGLSYEALRDDLHDLPDLISLPHEDLLRTENVAELLRQLEKSYYADIAVQARQVYEEKNEPFSLDATIDQIYYASLVTKARIANADNRQALLELIGSVIDQQNLLWLLRYRFNYQLSPSETYYLLIPSGRRLQRDTLKQMVNQSSVARVLDLLPEMLKPAFADVDDISAADRAMARSTVADVRRQLHYSHSPVARALAYLILRELDLKALYAIIQGKVLGLQPDLLQAGAGIDTEATEESHV